MRKFPKDSIRLRYGLTVVTVAVALLFTYGMWPWIQPIPSPPFYAAVMMSTWYGGLGPGLLATLFSTLIIDYFFVPPLYSLIPPWSSILLLSEFVCVALIINSLNEARRRTEQALRKALDNLELRVEERVAELAHINEALRVEIAERKRTEEKLGKREAQLAEAQHVAHMGSWEWDIPANKVTWSDELYRIYGLKPQEIGITYEIFLDHVHPEDREFAHEIIQRALQDYQPFSYDYRNLRWDGRVRALHARGEVILDETGRPVRMIGTAQDITERKLMEDSLRASEGRFRLLAEQASDIIYRYRFTPTPGFEYVSPAATLITGYTPEEHYADPYLGLKLVHPDDRQLLETFVQSPSSVGDPIILRWRRKDGTLIWTEQRNVPIYDEKGNLVAIEGVAREITKRQQMEEQIRASLKEKEILLREIHHRVKNNLQIISSLLDLQSDYIRDPQDLELFKESLNRVKSMALIHEKLYQSSNLAKIDFAEYVQNLTAHLFDSYSPNSWAVDLEVDIDKIFLDISTAIPCGLIVNELVSNSLKYAFPSGREGKIRIELRSEESKGDARGRPRFALRVSDNGVGFPKDLDFRNTPSLGLQLVVSLTQQLNGTIELDRSRGTAFTVTFVPPQP